MDEKKNVTYPNNGFPFSLKKNDFVIFSNVTESRGHKVQLISKTLINAMTSLTCTRQQTYSK